MIISSILVALSFTILDIAISAPLQDEKVEPVPLNNFCFRIKQNENDDNNKSPVLLIHGLGSSLADWNGVYEVIALGTGRQVCAVDLRNHGDSPWSNRSDVEAMAADILNFLDQRKIEKVNLVGHSLGGKTVVHFALKNPDRVDSLVVEDMRPNSINAIGLQAVKAAITLLQEAIKTVPDGSNEEEAKNAIVKYMREKLTGIGFDEETEEVRSNNIAIRFYLGKWQYKVNLDLMRKALDDPEKFLTPSTGVYEGPTLFIYGTKSLFDVPGDEKNIMKLFPNAKLIPIEGAGHAIHGQFKQFEEEIIKMLNKMN